MATHDFRILLSSGLLTQAEQLVVALHRALHRDLKRESWSPPAAYQWLHYEDQDPVQRLLEGSLRLDHEWQQALNTAAGDNAQKAMAAVVREQSDLIDAPLNNAHAFGFREES